MSVNVTLSYEEEKSLRKSNLNKELTPHRTKSLEMVKLINDVIRDVTSIYPSLKGEHFALCHKMLALLINITSDSKQEDVRRVKS